MTGAPAVTAIDLTYPAGQPAPLPAGAVAIFAVPVYGRHVAPAALERLREIRGEGTPAIVLAVYGNRSFGTAVAELASFVAERGFVPVAAGAFVGEHSYSTPETPIAQGRPDAQDLAAATAFGAQVREKLAKTGSSPGRNPETASDTAATTRTTQTDSMDAAKAPATAPLFPSTPRSCANRVHRSSRSCASSGSYWLPPPAETQPRRPAARGRCRTLHAMRPLRRTVPHAGHRTRRRAAHRPGTLHPLLRLRERVRIRCPHIPHALCSRPRPELRAAETARNLIITLIAT